MLAALAGFVPLPSPPGASQNDPASIADFAASGNTWVARTTDQSQLQLTSDGGQSWRPLSLGAGAQAGISVGPDGGFWLPAASGSAHELVHVTTDGAVSQQPVSVPSGLMSPPAWDGQGRIWVALSRAGQLSAIELNPDGSVAQQVDAAGAPARADFPWVRFDGATVSVGTSAATWRLSGGSLSLIAGSVPDQTEFNQFELWPVDSFDKVLVTFHAVLADSGSSFVYTDRQQLGVHGNPDLLLRFPFADQQSGVLLSRCSSFVFCDTGVDVPNGTAALWQTPAGVVAVSAESGGPTPPEGQALVLSIDRDPIPRQAPARGTDTRAARGLLARLNVLRAQAGLPALVDDPRMSATGLAHAGYLARHVARGKLGLDNAHTETPGTAGFTGVDPAARCKAHGTVRNGEEVITGPHPSDALASLYYHRIAPFSPYTQYVGVGRVGNYTVYNLDTESEALVVAPSGYPSAATPARSRSRARSCPTPTRSAARPSSTSSAITASRSRSRRPDATRRARSRTPSRSAAVLT